MYACKCPECTVFQSEAVRRSCSRLRLYPKQSVNEWGSRSSLPDTQLNLYLKRLSDVEGKRQSNPEVVLVSWVVCQAEGVRWSSLEAGKLAS